MLFWLVGLIDNENCVILSIQNGCDLQFLLTSLLLFLECLLPFIEPLQLSSLQEVVDNQTNWNVYLILKGEFSLYCF